MSIAPRFLRTAVAAGGLSWVGAAQTHAAMVVCEPSHAGEVAEDRSEFEARKRALASWAALATRHGEQYGRWGLAWNRQLDCAPTGAGTFRCKAAGHPCTIRQVPPTQFIPLKRGTQD